MAPKMLEPDTVLEKTIPSEIWNRTGTMLVKSIWLLLLISEIKTASLMGLKPAKSSLNARRTGLCCHCH